MLKLIHGICRDSNGERRRRLRLRISTVSPVVTWEAYEFAPPEETEVVGTLGPGRLDEADAPIAGS